MLHAMRNKCMSIVDPQGYIRTIFLNQRFESSTNSHIISRLAVMAEATPEQDALQQSQEQGVREPGNAIPAKPDNSSM